MSYTFDGPNKLIILSDGTTTLDVKDLYSRWKEWVALSDNSKYLPFFSVVGGDTTVGSNSISSYFYLLNGTKIKPYEGNHTLTINGILIGDGGAEIFADTIGNYKVRIVQVIPLQAETITVNSDGSTGTAPTASQIADSVWSHSFVSKLLTVAKFLGLK
jgi:hypothetical protein